MVQDNIIYLKNSYKKVFNRLSIEYKCLLNLISAALNQIDIYDSDNRASKVIINNLKKANLKQVYSLARKHDVAALCYTALYDKRQDFDGGEIRTDIVTKKLFERFQEAQLNSAGRDSRLEIESHLIMNELERYKVDHMPLINCEMKQLYQRPYMRSCSHVDIFIRNYDLDQLSTIMSSNQYVLKRASSTMSTYYKRPLSYVQLYKTLLPQKGIEQDYFRKALPSVKKEHRYFMSLEDSYILLVSKLSDSIKKKNGNLVYLIDLWVFNQAYSRLTDYSYIDKNLRLLGLYDLSLCFDRLAHLWFTPLGYSYLGYPSSGYSPIGDKEVTRDVSIKNIDSGVRSVEEERNVISNQVNKGLANETEFPLEIMEKLTSKFLF